MANLNIVIVARGNAVSRISYNAKEKKANAQDYTGVVSADVQGSTRINALSAIVRTMEQLAEKDFEKDKDPVAIFTVGLVADTIHKGTALYWLANDGKKSDGNAVNDKEMELWAQFYDLLAGGLLTHVIFKNVSDVKIPKNPKFAISMEQRSIAEYAEKAWERIQASAPEIEETDDEAL